jgi:hypothetical protein
MTEYELDKNWVDQETKFASGLKKKAKYNRTLGLILGPWHQQ